MTMKVKRSAVSAAAAMLGRIGAAVTNSKLSPAQRQQNAKKAIRTRWERYRREAHLGERKGRR